MEFACFVYADAGTTSYSIVCSSLSYCSLALPNLTAVREYTCDLYLYIVVASVLQELCDVRNGLKKETCMYAIKP